MLVLVPLAGLFLVGLFGAVLLLTRRVAAASLACAVALPVAIYGAGAPAGSVRPAAGVGFGLLVGLLLVVAHRDNIARLRAGREPKVFRRQDPGESAGAGGDPDSRGRDHDDLL